jgi:DNA topoisomerase-3
VERARRYESDTVPGDFVTLSTPCPKCGGVVKENYKKFTCQSCDWSTWKIIAGRQFEIKEIESLLREGRAASLMGFRNRMGRLFNADIVLNDEKQPTFDFGQTKEGEAEEADFSGRESVGVCPKCHARVFDNGTAYICEKTAGPGKSCDFRSGKIILQQHIEHEQMQKLLAEGKTDLLRGFVSARTHRKFSAFLVRGTDGKVGFECEPRTPKAAKTDTAKKGIPEGETTGRKSAPRRVFTKKQPEK